MCLVNNLFKKKIKHTCLETTHVTLPSVFPGEFLRGQGSGAAGLSEQDVAPPSSVGAEAAVLGQWHTAVATSTGSGPRCSQVLSSLWNEQPGPRQTLAALGQVVFSPRGPCG